MATKMQGSKEAGKKASAGLKASAKKEEKKVEAKKGGDLRKGADRVQERSKSSDGKGAGAKQR